MLKFITTRLYICLSLLTLLLSIGCRAQESSSNTSNLAIKDLFMDVALNVEFGSKNNQVRKWHQDVNIFIKNPEEIELILEAESIIAELNAMSSDISIQRVTKEEDANFLMFLSDHITYGNYETSAKKYLEGNWGMFWTYWNGKSEIYKASMYVDVKRTKDINCQKHLLREELTQALGLMNDSSDFEDSIFYSEWSCGMGYSELDKLVIKQFLNPNIKAGMTAKQVRKVLNWD